MKKIKSKRTCPECNIQYEPTRSDQKFCGATCRWNAWHKKEDAKKTDIEKEEKGLEGTVNSKSDPEKKDLFSSLRNVSENKEPEIKPKQTQTTEKSEIIPTLEKSSEKNTNIGKTEIKTPEKTNPTETKEWKESNVEKQRIEAFGQRVLLDLRESDEKINQIKSEIESFAKPRLSNKFKSFRRHDVDFQDLFGTEISEKEFGNNYRVQKLNETLEEEQMKRSELKGELDRSNREMNVVVNKLKTIPQFEKPKMETKLPDEKTANLNLDQIMKSLQLSATKKEEQNDKLIIEKEKPEIEPIQTNTNEPVVPNVSEEKNTFVEEENTNNPKILSSSQIRGMSYKSFPFTGKWKEFLGTPQYKFHLGIHGKPGRGKSTFCVQFADYLAKNFGKVIYISGEEGLSKTVQDKLVNNCIDNPYLFFADIRSYDEIKTEIPNEYHFIFIDSLDTLKIDSHKLRVMKEWYPQSSFITISQSTKNGQMRGSLEIMHDNDITVAVVKPGVAVTEKNRFHKTGLEFKIF